MVAEATDVRKVQLLIGGNLVDAAEGQTFESINPATDEVWAVISKAGTEDVDRAVAAARKAFDEGPWPGMPPAQRGRVLRKMAQIMQDRADEIGRLESMDTGKPLARATGEILGSAAVFDYYSGAADKFFGETIPMGSDVLSFTLREPLGVCAQIVPWNFPFMMSAWKLAPALAAGCTIILKPASNTPVTAQILGEIAYEAGVPEGVVNILPGPGGLVGEYLASHPGVDKVAFTGETATGAKILKAAADGIKKVSLELGGKSPNIIFDDADMEKAAAAAVGGAFGNSGQVCTARTRLFLQHDEYDNFMNLLIDQTEGFTVGNPLDDGTLMGPVISDAQWERVNSYVEIGKSEGAELVYGGSRPSHTPNGQFFQPTIFAQASNDMRIAREEIFGPVLTVIPFDDVDEVIKMANQNDYGLAGSVWSRDINKALRVAKGVQTGMMSVNGAGSAGVFGPFGGYKKSGIGRELGMHGLELYTQVKAVHIDLN